MQIQFLGAAGEVTELEYLINARLKELLASIHFLQSIRETFNWNDVIIPTLQSTFDIS